MTTTPNAHRPTRQASPALHRLVDLLSIHAHVNFDTDDDNRFHREVLRTFAGELDAWSPDWRTRAGQMLLEKLAQAETEAGVPPVHQPSPAQTPPHC